MMERPKMTKTNWKFCQTLDGTWWYEDSFTGAKLPPRVQPVCTMPKGFKEITIPKLNISQIKELNGGKNGD